MPVRYTNNAVSTLSAGIAAGATSLTVAAGHGSRFPSLSAGDHFFATLINNAGTMEIIRVTARSTDTLTITRGQDGTTAAAWNAGDRIELRITKAMLDDLIAPYAPSASPTFTGRIQSTGSQDANIVAVAALNIDCSAGNYFTKTINGNSTFTVSNVPASRAYAFTLELTHTSGTVTWFSGVQWPGGTAPTLTAGKVHLFTFVTDDGGTSWRGASQVNYNS